MSVEEKALQLSCVMPSFVLEQGVFDRKRAEKEMPKGIGRMTQFAAGFSEGPEQAAKGYNEIQKYMIEKCGLPALIQNESSSGTVAADATIFPVPIALASTFEPELSYKMGKVIADEGKAIGVHAMMIQNESSSGTVAADATIFPVPIALASTFEPELSYKMGKVIADEGKAIGVHAMMSPVADISRDARWGRVDETFGEDPLLSARFASEEVRGIQGEDYCG